MSKEKGREKFIYEIFLNKLFGVVVCKIYNNNKWLIMGRNFSLWLILKSNGLGLRMGLWKDDGGKGRLYRKEILYLLLFRWDSLFHYPSFVVIIVLLQQTWEKQAKSFQKTSSVTQLTHGGGERNKKKRKTLEECFLEFQPRNRNAGERGKKNGKTNKSGEVKKKTANCGSIFTDTLPKRSPSLGGNFSIEK